MTLLNGNSERTNLATASLMLVVVLLPTRVSATAFAGDVDVELPTTAPAAAIYICGKTLTASLNGNIG